MVKGFKVLFLVVLVSACAQGSVKSTGVINTHVVDGVKNVAIKGYDAVAYVRDKKAVKGSKKYQHKWKGATWFFSSNFNRRQFVKKPWMFAPKYGGYCAYGIAVPKEKIDIDPNAWYVHQNDLYLNNSKEVQAVWLKDKSKYMKDANHNWPDVKQQTMKKR